MSAVPHDFVVYRQPRAMWLLLAAVLLFVLGELGTLYLIVQYAFLVVVAGTVIALTGWRGGRVLLIPLEDADAGLQDFLRNATPQLAHHIPD